MNQRNDKKRQRKHRFSVNKLWTVTASSIEEAKQICRKFGIEPESVYPLIHEDVDCIVGAVEYIAEDPD